MIGTIILSSPITINGKKVKELTYDTNQITAAAFTEAEARKIKASASPGNMSGAAEIDYGFQLYIGFAAIEAVNPSYDIMDLERIKGPDLMEVMTVGRNFIIKSEDAVEAESEVPSETIPEPSTPQ